MAKYKIWKKSLKEFDKETSYIRLSEDKDGDIGLAFVGQDGEPLEGGFILFIDQHLDSIILQDAIDPKFPLKTDTFFAPIVARYDEVHRYVNHKRKVSSVDIGNIIQKILKEKSPKEQDDE